MTDRFKLQEERYIFPYHHLMDFESKRNYKILQWGFEYYAYINRVIELLKNLEFTSLLDVGCGDGKFIYELSKIYPKKELVGVDLSERAIFYAKALNYDKAPKFFANDVRELEGKYDVITLIETLEHVPDGKVSELIKNIKKLLKPGGFLIMTVPTTNIPLIKKHYRHYNLDLISKQLEGFDIKHSEYVVKNNTLFKLFLKLSGRLSFLPGMESVVFALSKKLLFRAGKHNGRHLICVLKSNN